MSVVLTPNMSLPVPSVGIEAGPEYATDVNNCLSLLDSHNHAPGQGVQIDPTGLNINADLPLGENNLTEIRSLRLEPQDAALVEATDLTCLYAVEDDLYFNDGLGNSIRLTQNGSIVGTSGSISNLVSPATASYVSATETFVWESDVNTPANMDAASVILRKVAANSPGITLQVPVALASDYAITLPALPSVQSFMTIDASGNIAAPAALTGGITLAMLVAAVQQALNKPGAIQMTGRSTPDTGWLMCDGSSVLRADYLDLFNVIGTAFGAADGTHFNLPDMRGKFPRGVAGASSLDPDKASRTAQATGGNTGNNVGSVQGNAAQSHSHTVGTRPNDSTGIGGPAYVNEALISSGGGSPYTTSTYSASGGGAQASSTETRPDNVYVNFQIKT